MDNGNTVQQTSDGGFVICGFTNYSDIWLVKTNHEGDTLWTKIYDSGGWDYGSYVQQTLDDGYIITGSKRFQGNVDSVWLIKTDVSGNTLWSRSFGGGNYNFGFTARQAVDKGYVIGANNDNGARLIKTDSTGETIWIKNYSNIMSSGRSLEQTSDGGYIISGACDSMAGLIKTDSMGDTLWTKKYFEGLGNSVQQTTDGGYIITGEDCVDWKLCLLKTDSLGNLEWIKKYSDNYELESFGNSVQQTNTADYIITGGKTYSDFDHEIWTIKVDQKGDILWKRSFDVYCGEAIGNSIVQTTDGGYIVAGYNCTNNPQGCDLWLIRLKPDINSVNEDPLPLQYGISQNFPNPFNPVTKIIYQLPHAVFVTIKVYDILGREVSTLVNEEKMAGSCEVKFDGSNLPSGIYYYQMKTERYSFTGKMVLLK
jgi:hypothetical protein